MALVPDVQRIKNLIGGWQVADDLRLQDFIDAATAVELARVGSGKGVSNANRTTIVEHLSAAFWEMGTGGGGLSAQSLADYSVTYATDSKALASLLTTRNGTIAVMLDTSGLLMDAVGKAFGTHTGPVAAMFLAVGLILVGALLLVPVDERRRSAEASIA